MGHFMDECKRIMIAVINMCGLLIGGGRVETHIGAKRIFSQAHTD